MCQPLSLNKSDIDLVFVEHEYGIFGGSDGEFVLDFVENLEKPFILNTHTILPSPEFHRRILDLGQKALAVICMTNRSTELLNKIYNVLTKNFIWYIMVFRFSGKA